jgi:hypothetical protein
MIQRLCRAVRIDKNKINKKANCFIWTENMEKIIRSLKILKENDINFIGKINYKKNQIENNSNLVKNKNDFEEELSNYFNEEISDYFNEEILDNSDINKNKLNDNPKIENDIINNIKDNKKYECDICKKNFNKKCDLERHLLRKKICNEYTKINLENKKFICIGCGKGFSQKRSLKVHIEDGYCKKNLNQINKLIINKNEYEDYIKYKNDKIKKLVIFGKEDNINIPINLYFNTIYNIPKGISLLTKFIHFNIDYQENKNIKGKGLSSKYVEVYDGKNWIIESKKNIIKKLIIKIKKILDDFINKKYKELIDSIPNNIIQKYEKETDKLDEVLNQDFRDKKPRDESFEAYKEVEEELNMLLETQRIINKEEQLKLKEEEKNKKKIKKLE